MFKKKSRRKTEKKQAAKKTIIIKPAVPKEEENQDTELDKKILPSATKEERTTFLMDSCEQIAEAERLIEETKVEYQAVTSYLTDIQRLDRQKEEDRETMNEAARKIITLTRERSGYQNRNIKITDKQFHNIEKYEANIVKAVRQMESNEQYALVIKNDMQHLETEKKRLNHQKKEIIAKQKYLKKLSIITFVLAGGLFLLLLGIAYAFESNMVMPYIMTIALAAGSAFYIFHEAGKNRRDILIVEKKLNRAISLLNKVKIKCINNTTVLDYACEKYGVTGSDELRYLWEQYLKAKEAAKRYKQNTELLNQFNEQLISEMRSLGVSDPEIWIYQAAAVIDNKEMVEIRHRLNIRRQKLRDRIEYNSTLKEDAQKQIMELLEKYPDMNQEAKNILITYSIKSPVF